MLCIRIKQSIFSIIKSVFEHTYKTMYFRHTLFSYSKTAIEQKFLNVDLEL